MASSPEIIEDVIDGIASTILQAYFDTTYGTDFVKVYPRLPHIETVAKLKTAKATAVSTIAPQAMCFVYETEADDETEEIGTPGTLLQENYTINVELFFPHLDTDAQADAWRLLFRNVRRELAKQANIRAQTGNAGIRVWPWKVVSLGTSNRGGFNHHGHLEAMFNNQPHDTTK